MLKFTAVFFHTSNFSYAYHTGPVMRVSACVFALRCFCSRVPPRINAGKEQMIARSLWKGSTEIWLPHMLQPSRDVEVYSTV